MKGAESIFIAPPATQAGTRWCQALRGALVLMGLCGVLYPLVTVSIGTFLFPHQSTGSLIERDSEVIGSVLVGQSFAAPAYFHGRPSAAGYDPSTMSGSNWASSNPALRKRAQVTSETITKQDNVAPDQVPVDLIAASGSGIDPDISPDAARIQIDRIAATRGLPPAAVAALVETHVQMRVLGILGQPRINVLQLNLALDALGPPPSVP